MTETTDVFARRWGPASYRRQRILAAYLRLDGSQAISEIELDCNRYIAIASANGLGRIVLGYAPTVEAALTLLEEGRIDGLSAEVIVDLEGLGPTRCLQTVVLNESDELEIVEDHYLTLSDLADLN